MNFILKEKIINARNLIITNGNIFFSKENKIFRNFSLLWEGDSGDLEFDILEEVPIILNNNNTIILDKGGKLTKRIEFPIILRSVVGNRGVFTIERNLKEKNFKRAYFDFEGNFNKLNDLDNYKKLGKTFFYKGTIFFNELKSNNLRAIGFNDVVNWEYDLSILPSISIFGEFELPKIEEFLGVYGEELIILLNGGRVLFLDLITGEFQDLVNLNTYFETNKIVFESLHLDQQSGVIKCLCGRYYFELDVKTLDVKIKKDFGEYVAGNWWITRTRPYDNLLTFVGSKDGTMTFANQYGVFDTQTLEILWFDGIDLKDRESKGFFSTPPYMNNSIFAITSSEKVLYVYEKS